MWLVSLHRINSKTPKQILEVKVRITSIQNKKNSTTTTEKKSERAREKLISEVSKHGNLVEEIRVELCN